jgi:phospholipid:diacylglycerol acyltransferase
VGFLVLLWLAEVSLLVLLKRFGVVAPGFRLDEAVLSAVDADASTRRWLLEQQEVLLARLNESLLQAAPLVSAHWLQESKRPGYQLAAKAAADPDRHKQEGGSSSSLAKHPVVMVPGFVTSGLEVWAGRDCAKRYFRQRLWAAANSARTFILDTECWKEHMSLDPATGGDPDGIRLRPSSGFEAADYFIANYWVWSKLIDNLADVGYSPSNMAMMPYDWRLAFPLLEERDGYLTQLKSRIEGLRRTAGHKVVLASHSMGALVVHYFFAWVAAPERDGGGGGGGDWVDRHVHAYVNIAGSHLGVPKAASALLSGEMSDTIIMGPMGTVVEQFFGRRLRRQLWSSWGSLWAMLPKGGDALWSSGADLCSTLAPDDPFCHPERPSPLLFMTSSSSRDTAGAPGGEAPAGACPANDTVRKLMARSQLSADDAVDFLLAYHAGSHANHSAARLFSFRDGEGGERPSPRTWHDPTRTPLPRAPSMRLYCFYGTGIDTERAYYYRAATTAAAASGDPAPEDTPGTDGAGNASSLGPDGPGGASLPDPALVLDVAVDNEGQKVRRGVRYADGDGSVPLLSLGYLCADAWRRPSSGLNPSMLPVTTREYPDRKEFVVDDPMRGGPRSSEHVDVLGNVDMMADLLRVVTGYDADDVRHDRISSDIRRVAERVNSYHGGGLFKRRKRFLWNF